MTLRNLLFSISIGIRLLLFPCFGQVEGPDIVSWVYPRDREDSEISLKNKDIQNKINIVVLGDGYTKNEQEKFQADIADMMRQIFSVAPLKTYKSYFNVFTISIISNQSGVTHEGLDLTSSICQGFTEEQNKKVDNYLESSFDLKQPNLSVEENKKIAEYTKQLDDCEFIDMETGLEILNKKEHEIEWKYTHRMLSINQSKVLETVQLMGLGEISDQILVIVNSEEYGGSANSCIAISTINQNAVDVIVHEVGHSLFNLRDEYWTPEGKFDSYNFTDNSDKNTVKWRNWISPIHGVGIGVYEYPDQPEGGKRYYKPSRSCKMGKSASMLAHTLNKKFDDFCSVCREGIVVEIHKNTEIIYDIKSPFVSETIKQDDLIKFDAVNFPLRIQLGLNKPDHEDLKSEWKLNGEVIDGKLSLIDISKAQLKYGENKLIYTIEDKSKFLRLDGRPELQEACKESRTFIINYNPQISSTLFLFDLSGSMNQPGSSSAEKLAEAKDASKDALERLKKDQSTINQVGLFGFSGDCNGNFFREYAGFTENLSYVESEIDKMDANGGTPLWEAIEKAKCELAQHLGSTGQEKGKIIILSDGEATCNTIRPQGTYSFSTSGKEMSVNASECGVSGNIQPSFFTVGFNIQPGSAAERDLQYLASVSGGKYWHAPDQRQLEMAFRKFNRVYRPKRSSALTNVSSSLTSQFSSGVSLIQAESYREALTAYETYVAQNQTDDHGVYNLALMQEANDWYQPAIDNYRQYLAMRPDAPDRAYVETQIERLEEEFVEFVRFQKKVIKSDLAYLKLHFEKIQNGESVALAHEFKGFLREKGAYYNDLPKMVGRSDRIFKRNADEVSRGLESCAKTISRNPQTWDRDATPFLSMTYLNMERLLQSFR